MRYAGYVALALCGTSLSAVAQGTGQSHPRDQSVLQQHYEAAQHYQAAHDLERAAYEYRMFLTDALGELAIARAHAGQYEKAADSFDEALRFAPHAADLQLEFAQAALQAGDPEHARTLAQAVVQEAPQNASAHLVLGQALLKTNANADARKELEQAVALDSNFADGYELAVACLDLGDEKCASNLFTEMTKSFGDTAQLHMYFGQAYLNSDFQTKAVTEFEKAIAENPRLHGAHYSLAAAYLVTGRDVKTVEEEIRKEILVSPKDAVSYAGLGHLEAGQHEEEQAEKDLKRAVALDPRNPDGFFYLGQLYVDLKRPQEAEAALRTSIQLTKDVSRNQNQVQKAHYLLGRILLQAGDKAEGQKELQAAAALNQQSLSRDRDRLASYYQQEPGMASGMGASDNVPAPVMPASDPEAATAADSFEKQITPVVADSYNNLGAIAGSQRDYGEALTDFQRAAEWSPGLEGLDENWGRAAFAAGQFQQAIPLLERYLKTHPQDTSMQSALGVSQYMVKDYAGARTTLQPVASIAGATAQMKFLYAESLVRSGDTAEGIRQLKALEQISGNSAVVHRALGEALAQSGDKTGAADELNAAIRLNPKDAEAFGALGKLQLSQGHTADAVANLESAVKLSPQDGSLHQSLAEAYRQASRPNDAAREMQVYARLSGDQNPAIH